jgi:aspartyl-tRNA synthetase
MSFVTQDDVFNAIEPVLSGVFEEFANGKTVTPAGEYPRIPYKEALLKYGTDKPDLRNPLLISDVGEHFKGSGFGLFAGIVEKGAVVRAVRRPGTAEKSRKFFDDMNEWARAKASPASAMRPARRRMGRPDRQEPRPEGMNRSPSEWASAPTTASSSPPARKRKRPSSPARRAPASASSST